MASELSCMTVAEMICNGGQTENWKGRLIDAVDKRDGPIYPKRYHDYDGLEERSKSGSKKALFANSQSHDKPS